MPTDPLRPGASEVSSLVTSKYGRTSVRKPASFAQADTSFDIKIEVFLLRFRPSRHKDITDWVQGDHENEVSTIEANRIVNDIAGQLPMYASKSSYGDIMYRISLSHHRLKWLEFRILKSRSKQSI
jgi:hypothetical protein